MVFDADPAGAMDGSGNNSTGKHGGMCGNTDFHGVKAGVKTAELPKESVTEFSNAPFEFKASAKSLWEDTQLTYYHACTENRFSENYLALCSRLEKNIRRMGSLCLTKAVLEQNHIFFPELADLNVTELVRMVSFHMRKAHAAFRGIYQDNNYFGMSYLNWEFRWFTLGSQLKATEMKIQKIRAGELKSDELLNREKTFCGQTRTNEREDQSIPRSLPVNDAALPLDGSLARKLLEGEQAAERERQREQKIIERESREITRELMKNGIFPDMFELLAAAPQPGGNDLLPEEILETSLSGEVPEMIIDVDAENFPIDAPEIKDPQAGPVLPKNIPKHRRKRKH